MEKQININISQPTEKLYKAAESALVLHWQRHYGNTPYKIVKGDCFMKFKEV